MSKINKSTTKNIEDLVMDKVRSAEVRMKPKWYFVLGSVLAIVSLTALTIAAVFATNLSIFLLRQHGPMGQWRLEQMLNSLPWWIPILAILSAALSAWLLKRFDFSYRQNFPLILLGFIISIILAAFILDQSGLNDTWSRRGPMRRFYQQLNQTEQMPLYSGRRNNRLNYLPSNLN